MTEKITLASGVPCTVGELTGKHQRILTRNGGEDVVGNLSEILLDVIKELGSIKVVSEEDIKNLLNPDRKKILITARDLAVRGTKYAESFTYEFEYSSKKTGKKETYPYEVSLKDGFPETPMQEVVAGELKPVKYRTYKEVNVAKVVTIVLPRSKKVVEYTMLDGYGQELAAGTKEENMSTHTPILMRNPKEILTTGSEEGKSQKTPILLDNRGLDNLGLVDIEFLREDIKKREGRVDTEVQFKHPELDKFETFDVTTSLAFFFLSGSI